MPDRYRDAAAQLASAKRRAIGYLDLGNRNLAMSSVISDLAKHPRTANLLTTVAVSTLMRLVMRGDRQGVQMWIEQLTLPPAPPDQPA